MDAVGKPLSQQYEATVLTTERTRNSASQSNNHGKTAQVKKADPTALMVTPPASSDLTPRTLSDYAANCQSLRNLVKPPKYSHVSVPPESLISEADKRLLSLKELDIMHKQMSQKTEITIGGQNFKLEKLAKDAPLFYQFYCLNDDISIDTKSLAIFERNCLVEKSRPVIILTHSLLMNKTVKSQIERLVNNYKNVFSVDLKDLLPELQIPGITITGKKDHRGDFTLYINPTDYLSNDWTDFFIYAWETSEVDHIMDVFHCIAAYHCDKICNFAGVKNSGPGCVKLDWDTELFYPTGELQCPNGIRVFVIDSCSEFSTDLNYNLLTHILRAEMGLVALTRPRHPVMAKALTRRYNVYGGFRIAVNNLFHQPKFCRQSDRVEVTLIPDDCELLKIMCAHKLRGSICEKINPKLPLKLSYGITTSWLQKIAFPLETVKVDQSRLWGICSWEKTESAPSQQENQKKNDMLKALACNIL